MRFDRSLIFLLIASFTVCGSYGQATPLEEGTLWELARKSGGKYGGAEHPNWGVVYPNLDLLGRASAVVFVGTVSTNRCRLSLDERHIATNYFVEVEEVLKGELMIAQIVRVSVPGGLIIFPDKSVAVTRVQNFPYRKMQNGKRYVLFLTGDTEGDYFALTGGPQGVFELSSDGRGVQVADGRRDHPLVQKYAGLDVQTFLAEVRQAANFWR